MPEFADAAESTPQGGHDHGHKHERDFRIMLWLAGTTGVFASGGFFAARSGAPGWLTAGCFVIAYLSGGWFATEEVFDELRHGRIDVHFLMLVVAVGALFVNAWSEGAI